MSTLKKPTLKPGDVLQFAEAGEAKRSRGRPAAAPGNPKQSGAVPEGDVRLVANIRSDLHKKLKHRAVDEETTVGELIERWIEGWK